MFVKSLVGVGALAGALILTPASGQVVVKIDGSSTVFPIAERLAEDFQEANKGVQVTVGMSGTGGGFKKFCRGEIDISNASRPILAKEMEDAAKNGVEYIELPIAFDALTVMVHPKNTFVDNLTIAELKSIWQPEAQGAVMTWNQVRAGFPEEKITLYGAGSDSGTFDYFTEAVTGKAKASRGDYTASEDDNTLVQGISKDVHALGYFGYAYYANNKDKLRAVPIVNKQGHAVMPSEESVMDGTYSPLARPIFMYVNAKSLERPAVRNFVEYALKHGSATTKEVDYVPLPDSAYEAGLARMREGKTGTAFGGHSETGVPIGELFSRPVSNTIKAPQTKHAETKEEKK